MMRAWAALLVLAALAAGFGCESPSHPARSETPEQLWQQAREALDEGRVEAAAGLMRQSLAAKDSPALRGSAVIALFEADRPDLAAGLVDPSAGVHQAALAEAVNLLAGQPGGASMLLPAGHAIAAEWAMPGRTVGLDQPIRFARADLAETIDLLQAWSRLAMVEQGLDLSQARSIALWKIPLNASLQPAAVALAHPAGGDHTSLLVHLGSWPITTAAPADDLVGLLSGEGPARLVMLSWVGAVPIGPMAMEGWLGPDGLVVDSAEGGGLFQAAVAALGDSTIAPGSVLCRDQAEMSELLAWVDHLGRGEDVQVWGLGVSVPLPDGQTDYADPGLWLAELAGYIRYGREIVLPPGTR